MRNGFAANHGCQFLSLSYSLIDGLKGVQIVSLRRLHAVKNQGCARELGLLQNGTPCCGNQIFKVSLVSRHETATEIEGQLSKQTWCLQKGKGVPSVHQQDCYNEVMVWLIYSWNSFANLLRCSKPSCARAIDRAMNITPYLIGLFWDWFPSLNTGFQP